MENASKKSVYEVQDVLTKEENYKSNNGRVAPSGIDETSFAFKGRPNVGERERRND